MRYACVHCVMRPLILSLVLSLAASGLASAQTLTKPPELLRQVEAEFPSEMLDAGTGGTVVMEIDIGADGAVLDARVVQSAGAAFDAAALGAIRQFQFSPAEVDGQPAPVRILYSYEFLFRPQVVQSPPVEPTAQQVNLRGKVLQRGTRDPLANATVAVLLPDGARETHTDVSGGFEFKGLPTGTFQVVVSAQDHARYEVTETIEEQLRTEAVYYVRRLQYGANETVVRDVRERKEVSRISLRQEEIRLMPGTQGDALKVVQNLPGVARAPYSAGLLVVRGGKPWDTRVYVDQTLVPQLFHFGGLYATFNSNLLEDIAFQPGNFSAEYGRNIGGLIRAETRTPSKQGVHGYVDLNLIDVSGMVEAPLGEEWSFAAGARRSHIAAVLPFALDTFAPEVNDALSFTVAPQYHDYQLKLERRVPNSRDRLQLSFFGAHDEVAFVMPNPAFDPEGRGEFGTMLTYNRLVLNWDKGLTGNLRSVTHVSLGADRGEFSAGSDIYAKNTSYPGEARQTFHWDLSEQNLQLATGVDLLVVPYNSSVQIPPRFKLNQIPDPFVSRQLLQDEETRYPYEAAVFAEAVWTPFERLKLVPGVRVDYESTMEDLWVDPRLAAFFRVADGTSLKAGVGRFHQPPDYRQGMLSSTFGNPDLLPEAADHYSVGVEHQFTEVIGLDVQLYYKRLFDQAEATLAPPAGSEASVDTVDLRYESSGSGRSYGVELLLRHQLSKNFFGWIAYSLSRTEQRDPVTGRMRLSALDQTHNLVALGSYTLPYDFILGARVRYTSGALTTPYAGAIYDANGNYYFPIPGERFSRRLPAYFQLDLRLDKRFVYDTWSFSVYADVQNVTNRQNVEGVSWNFDYTEQQYVSGLPILPAIGVRGEF